MLPQLHGEFTVVADPELRFAQSGNAVARVRLVANSRKKNDEGEWVDDKTLWMTGSAFGKLAENMVESVQKGSRVVVAGRVVTDEWTDDAGEKQARTALLIDKFGVDLMFDPAKSVKAEKKAETQGAQKDDPWKGGDDTDPPF